MTQVDPNAIQAAEMVLPCADLTTGLQFYVDELGFRLEEIFPADAPRVAVVSGYGVRLRLDRNAETGAGILRLVCRDGGATGNERISPDGTRVQFVHARPRTQWSPTTSEVVVQRADPGAWKTGRAGMQYRDLISDRLGGRYIASHIRIPNGGPVADYVHHHQVQFQMIYCRRGWVRVVYEDQGAPFKMHTGDCVLQPPHIRHRVMESSDNMEVIEICCPAEHPTLVDHEMTLPTARIEPNREFGGQRFVFHQAKNAVWQQGPYDAFESTDLGIAAATRGAAAARILRLTEGEAANIVASESECMFNFMLGGAVTLDCADAGRWTLSEDDAFVLPAGASFSFTSISRDLNLLQVFLSQAAASDS